LGLENFQVTIDATYTPPANDKTTGGQIAYHIRVRNTGTAILKHVQLSIVLPKGTSLRTNASGWNCTPTARDGARCTLQLESLPLGQEASHDLDLDITAEIDIEQITFNLNATTKGTTIAPPTARSITVIGPDAKPRVYVFIPGLSRYPDQSTP
jgi:uncharacterized repeat protein (TIGR01451 family)